MFTLASEFDFFQDVVVTVPGTRSPSTDVPINITELTDTLLRCPVLVEEDVTLLLGVLVEADGPMNNRHASEAVAQTSLAITFLLLGCCTLLTP